MVAAVGLSLPGGLFLYWLFADATSLSAALSDRLALAFAVDLLGSTAILRYCFARKPLGPVRWPWFLGLSLLGTLWFGIPVYLWLNWRLSPGPKTGFTIWWRSV